MSGLGPRALGRMAIGFGTWDWPGFRLCLSVPRAGHDLGPLLGPAGNRREGVYQHRQGDPCKERLVRSMPGVWVSHPIGSARS